MDWLKKIRKEIKNIIMSEIIFILIFGGMYWFATQFPEDTITSSIKKAILIVAVLFGAYPFYKVLK